MKIKIIGILFGILFSTSFAYAQRESREIRSGNSEYKNEEFSKATAKYREALEINNRSFAAQFNYGNALYRQALTDSTRSDSLLRKAIREYTSAGNMVKEGENKDLIRYAKTQYNIGNCFYQSLRNDTTHQDSINDYVNARKHYIETLKYTPDDNDARRNLALINKILKPNPKNEQQQEQEGQQGEQEQQEQQQEQEQQQAQQDEEQEDQDKMDKEMAAQLLEALEQDEKETQKKVQAQQQPQGKRRPEKNW